MAGMLVLLKQRVEYIIELMDALLSIGELLRSNGANGTEGLNKEVDKMGQY